MTRDLEDSEKEREIAEIKRRIEYLIKTDQIADSEKELIVAKALKIFEQSETTEEVL